MTALNLGPPDAASAVVPIETCHAISQFLYREARMLDAEQYRQWLGLLDPEIHYLAPGRQSRFRKDPAGGAPVNAMAHFDERFVDLDLRVRRFESPMAWAEDPPTRLCRAVSAVEVEATDDPDRFVAHSVVFLCRNRNEVESTQLVYRRTDTLRREGADWRIADRLILINEAVLLYKNISTFL